MSESKILLSSVCLLFAIGAFAQSTVKAVLEDSSTGDKVGYATVSITKQGAKKPLKYVLSNEAGVVSITDMKPGTYMFKAELMGFQPFEKEIKVSGNLDMGVLRMKPDQELLDAAKVSAVGNAVIMKKDTIEYNASSFKTTENDVLEDLLKKLPGVEIATDGSITVNGETIKKITIDGKTFFLDDPQLASKNIPAKIINKVKVVEKKSDQAAFTGIDDGEEETVIDLSVKKGMMKGAFGNIMGGVGHDLMPDTENYGDYRMQGAAFLGHFTDHHQLSVILNANNTNNRGFNDVAGSMMRGMRGGGGGMGRGTGGWGNSNGITTSYMGGLNGAWDLFDNRMQLGGNYLYNYSGNDVSETTDKKVFQSDDDYFLYKSGGISNSTSGGHRFGVRLEHKFSENTSIIFEPQVNFGTGNYFQKDNTDTYRNGEEASDLASRAWTNNDGANRNVSTSGFLLLRQRLGIPGRTLTAMARYSFSDNVLDGFNRNGTEKYQDGAKTGDDKAVDQKFNNVQNSASLMGRITFTEPLGNHFYVEANYMYRWSKSTSDKTTWEGAEYDVKVPEFTNRIANEYVNQEIGANVLYQTDKIKAQLGFAAKPTYTHNTTAKGTMDSPVDTSYTVWNFAPQAMFMADFSKNSSLRIFYRGTSEQPGVSQLIPILDNTDPLAVSFGNPTLRPSFNHSIRANYRFNNRKKFTSFNVRMNGGYTQNPVVSALWYGNGGKQYTMPFNGPSSANANVRMFGNFPIAKSNFSIMNVTNLSWSQKASYVLENVDMSTYAPDDDMNYALFIADYNAGKIMKTENLTHTYGFMERLRLTYRSDNLELQAGARTRMNHSRYTISSLADRTTTWNNQATFNANWTWDLIGLTMKGEFNYNWYAGYNSYQPEEYIFNAEIQKLLFKKKFTLALKAYDILNQSKNLTVTDESNSHIESRNNTLGRYIILSLTYRFGNMDKSKVRGGMGGPRRF